MKKLLRGTLGALIGIILGFVIAVSIVEITSLKMPVSDNPGGLAVILHPLFLGFVILGMILGAKIGVTKFKD